MIQRIQLPVCLLSALLALASHPAQAAPPGEKAAPSRSGPDIDLDIGIRAGISIGEARQLAQQHGLSGAKPLPPGIAKNLARGKPLPPGIQKTRMPHAFVEGLPRHAGYEWRQAGADLVLVATATLVVSDILQGVFD